MRAAAGIAQAPARVLATCGQPHWWTEAEVGGNLKSGQEIPEEENRGGEGMAWVRVRSWGHMVLGQEGWTNWGGSQHGQEAPCSIRGRQRRGRKGHGTLRALWMGEEQDYQHCPTILSDGPGTLGESDPTTAGRSLA